MQTFLGDVQLPVVPAGLAMLVQIAASVQMGVIQSMECVQVNALCEADKRQAGRLIKYVFVRYLVS